MEEGVGVEGAGQDGGLCRGGGRGEEKAGGQGQLAGGGVGEGEAAEGHQGRNGGQELSAQ